MTTFLTSLTAFLVAIGVLVAVHEWGHYIVARLLGVKVLRFSIGFGRPLWMRRSGRDQTEYCISAIPIGGYVKLLDERDCDVPPEEQIRAFNRQPIMSRIAILFAGPALNFVFAILAYWCMFVVGIPGAKPVVGAVDEGSVAAAAGLRAGDRILAVGRRPVSTWEGAVLAMLDEMLGQGDIPLRVGGAGAGERSVLLPTRGRESELTEPGALFDRLGIEPWSPKLPPVIDELTPDGAAEAAGLQPGDRVVEAEGEPIETWPEWVDFVRARPGQEILVVVMRGDARLSLPLRIAAVSGEDGDIGRIGASVRVPEDLFASMRALQRYAPAPALVASLSKTWEMSTLTVRMVARMVTGDVSPRNISGPINIAQYAGYSASIGVVPFLNFLAIVSISLGILNLLPIPMLDGGQIVYQLAEAAKGSPLSERTQIIGQQMGILLLLLLMSFAFYNDLSRIFG
jgi:regulator of sigma E protease